MRFATAAMGTRFEIVIDDGPDVDARNTQAIGECAVAEIERLHRQLSFFASDSMLSHINRTAARSPVRLDTATFDLLQTALDVGHRSCGLFDVTRGGGMDYITLDRTARTIRFARPGITIDLGGIAKGHAVDCAAALLRTHGITRALVHGGTSSIAAIGAPRDCTEGWAITLAPANTDILKLRDTTLSVSSTAIREHIVDPRTGTFAGSVRIAAVIGPNATIGDAWSTAAAVLGRRPDGLGTEWKSIIE